MANGMIVFSGNAHLAFAKECCRILDLLLGEAEVTRFPDGETSVKFNHDIRGADVFIIQPTCSPVNENLMELLIMIDCARRASARRITAVIPYFGYARQDRKDQGRVPITAKLVADLITAAGANRVLTVDLHSAQIQGFFDIPVDHLLAQPVLARELREMGFSGGSVVIVSPDVGSIKMARGYAKALGAHLATVDKQRMSGGETQHGFLIGDVEGFKAVLVDDLIATAGSISDATKVLLERGALNVSVCATHAVLCGPAKQRLASVSIRGVLVSDTIPQDGLPQAMHVVSLAPLIAEAMQRIHENESLHPLFI